MAETQGNQSGTRSGAPGRGGRGFAGMDPARQREIASQGGRAAHQQGVAHEFDSNEAREAGRLGGQAVSQDRAHMAMIGARGGQASRAGARNAGRESGAGGTDTTTDPQDGGRDDQSGGSNGSGNAGQSSGGRRDH